MLCPPGKVIPRSAESAIPALRLDPNLPLVISTSKPDWEHGGLVPEIYFRPYGFAMVREHSSAVELCAPHVAISPAMVWSSNKIGGVLHVVRSSASPRFSSRHCVL